jgi:hypothetical protein
MHKSTQPSRSPFQRLVSRCSPGVAVFLATLLALPVNAGITLPNDPLTTASRIPPNVLFILDDSGSMAWRYMYNPDITTVAGGGINSTRTGNNTGSDNTGGDDTGSDHTGSDSFGQADGFAHPDHAGSDDTGSDDTGSDDTGCDSFGEADGFANSHLDNPHPDSDVPLVNRLRAGRQFHPDDQGHRGECRFSCGEFRAAG